MAKWEKWRNGNGVREMGELEKSREKKAPAVTACHASRLPAFAASVMGEVR